MPLQRTPSATRPPTASNRTPQLGGIAKAKEKPKDGPHVIAVLEKYQNLRHQQGGSLSEQQRTEMSKDLRRAQYADEHGSYYAGDTAHAADIAAVESRRKKLRDDELRLQCGLSKSSQAAKVWREHDPALGDVRAAPAKGLTPKTTTPLSRTSSSSRTPPGEDVPKEDLIARLMAASSPDASPMAGVAATPRVPVNIDPLDFVFDTPSGSDDTPSI
jgi:hypothetical protein